MSSTGNSKQALPIKRSDLEPHSQGIINKLKSVTWIPKAQSTEASKTGEFRFRTAPTGASPEEVSVLLAARKLSGDADLMKEGINRTINTVKTGLSLGLHLAAQYGATSGLLDLVNLNRVNRLSDSQKTEMSEKTSTAAAIATFASSAYVAWDLSGYKTEEVGSLKLEFEGVPEFTIADIFKAVDCEIFYYGKYLQSPVVNTELAFVKLTTMYFKSIMEEVVKRVPSLRYVDFFTNYIYKLEGTEFSINGFTATENGGEISVEFNRVEIDEIVGNRDAKHTARRLVDRLLCYDLATKRNPMRKLGGLASIMLGHGEPGTGKSMLIAALATMLYDRCQWVGLPFLFHPMPDTVVSTFQGGSAENMLNWMKALKDAGKIIFAPIDDAENNLEERTRQGVSAGVREVIAVFLRNTEGAYAVNHGNTVIQLYTNIPDQIDRAVMSRVVDRTHIGGAKDWKDFLDQDYLWWGRYKKIDSGFIVSEDPLGYEYLSAQAEFASLSALEEGPAEPSEKRVKEIHDRVIKNNSAKGHRFFGELYAEVKKDFPFFTSRDVRNIQRAVDGRILDFDFPTEWHDNPKTFFRQDYDQKEVMLLDLVKQNMKGLTFDDIRQREAFRYLDNMVKIVDAGHEREIDQLVARMKNQEEALKRFKEQTEAALN